MKLTTLLLAAPAAVAIAACSPGDNDAPPTDMSAPAPDEAAETESAATQELAEKLQDVAAASYSLDQNHAFLTFTVMHNGLSEYTVNFTDFDADLQFDPQAPESSRLTLTIDPSQVNVSYPGDYKAGHPDSEFDSWTEALARDERFMNADDYGEITFVTTEATRTGDYTGTVTGDLTFRGQTQPVTMDVTYNGVTNKPWYGERDLIGFDATGTINRSDFGVTALEGMISDEVEINFSGEFLQDEATGEPAMEEPVEE